MPFIALNGSDHLSYPWGEGVETFLDHDLFSKQVEKSIQCNIEFHIPMLCLQILVPGNISRSKDMLILIKCRLIIFLLPISSLPFFLLWELLHNFLQIDDKLLNLIAHHF